MSEDCVHARLNDEKNVVQLFEAFPDEDFFYIITKYASKGNLLQYMAQAGIECMGEPGAKSVT